MDTDSVDGTTLRGIFDFHDADHNSSTASGLCGEETRNDLNWFVLRDSVNTAIGNEVAMAVSSYVTSFLFLNQVVNFIY